LFRCTKASENLFHSSALSIIHSVPQIHTPRFPSATYYAEMAQPNDRVR